MEIARVAGIATAARITGPINQVKESDVSEEMSGSYAVSILFVRQTPKHLEQQLRLGTFQALNKDEALGIAIRAFRDGDVHKDANISLEIVLPIRFEDN